MKQSKHWKGIILFLAPLLILYSAYFIYPFGFVIYTSLNKWNGISPMRFVGLENYKYLFAHSTFQISIRNNIIWALALGFLQVGLAAIVAFILARTPPFWKTLRTIYFIPKVVSAVAIAMLWRAVYNAEYGALNGVISLVSGREFSHNWLGSYGTALGAIIAQEVMYIGYFMIIILAGVMSIPRSLYEAAEIDGANVWQQEIHITLPGVWGILTTAMTLAMAYGLRHFEQTFLMTGGGPGHATSVLGLMMYNRIGERRLGQAAAIGMILVITGFFVIMILRYFLGKKLYAAEEI